MVFKQEVNIPLALTIGLISGLLLLVMTFGVQAWYATEEQAEANAKAAEGPPNEFAQLKQSQKEKIAALAWCDSNKANVTVPIERAMEIMVKTNGNLPRTQPTTSPATTAPVTTGPETTAPATTAPAAN